MDTAISSLSLGPGHNPTESLVEMLEGTGFTTELDAQRLLNLKRYFNTVRPRYKEFLSNITGVETEIFASQIPGGMISNMESQLKQQGAGDKLQEVLEEVPRVRKDAGYPPLVTPSSQIVGSQAVFNVMMGRYKVLTGEFADLMLGYYGETIGRRDRAADRAGRQADQEGPDRHASRRFAEAGVAAVARRGARSPKGCNGIGRRRPDVRHVPAGGAKFFGTRDQGPKNLGKDPNAKPAAACSARRERLRPRPARARCGTRSPTT